MKKLVTAIVTDFYQSNIAGENAEPRVVSIWNGKTFGAENSLYFYGGPYICYNFFWNKKINTIFWSPQTYKKISYFQKLFGEY